MRLLQFLSIILGLLWASAPQVLAFDSGSSEADGALNFVCGSPQVIDWDPTGLDIDENGVFDFTTINVDADCTVRLLVSAVGFGPVVWLASGNVVIDGVIELNGEAGHSSTIGPRVNALPGPGGFPGGIGKLNGTGVTTNGFGPGGGGKASGPRGGSGGHFSSGAVGSTGGFGGAAYGSGFLRPLIGGSGGGGSSSNGGGGAGGGALLIASTTSISVEGEIHADGGEQAATFSGGGSGGAIRLVAPEVVGTGSITALGATGGSKGRIRIESDSPSFTGNQLAGQIVSVSLLPNTPLLDDPSIVPSLRIVSIGGESTPGKPTGGFSPVDVTIDTATTVTIVIESTNVTVGTIVTLEVNNQTTGTQTFFSEGLFGVSDPLTADVLDVAIDSGLSRIFLRAGF